MFFDQTRKVLVIGASGGIGATMSRLLLDHGHDVHMTCRNLSSQTNTQQFANENGLPLIELDLTQQHSIAAAFEQLQQHTEKLHLVMNCTGLLHDDSMQPEKRLEDLEMENLQRSFQLNSCAPLLIARYALPLLKHDEPGVLATISARVGSISDNRIGGWYGYRASKAAQNMATRSVAIEMKRRCNNVIVIGLHPGTVDTRLSSPFQSSVKAGQLKTPTESAQHLYDVINQVDKDASGKVFAWDGSEIPA